jgi:hypothetical protein
VWWDACGENDKTLPKFLTAVEVADILRVLDRMLEGMRIGGREPPYLRLTDARRSKVNYNLTVALAWAMELKKT